MYTDLTQFVNSESGRHTSWISTYVQCCAHSVLHTVWRRGSIFIGWINFLFPEWNEQPSESSYLQRPTRLAQKWQNLSISDVSKYADTCLCLDVLVWSRHKAKNLLFLSGSFLWLLIFDYCLRCPEWDDSTIHLLIHPSILWLRNFLDEY